MKNKFKIDFRIYKYMLEPIIYFILSCMISGTVLLFTYEFMGVLYYTASSYGILRTLMDTFLRLKWNFTGNSIYFIIFLILSMLIYIAMTYRRNKSIVSLIDSVDIMANGNLEQTIEVESKGDIEKLGNNINSIVSQLRNITVEERRAQQTKTDLITNVSHDLRTPLTSIIGYLGLIEDDKYKDEVHLRYYTKIAYDKSKSLNVLINDLFELTKMQNNTMVINKVNINLVELIGQIMSHFEYSFKDENITGRVEFSEDKLIIDADPTKLVRVFENLITNGMKYGNDGGYIDIVTEKEDDMAVVKVINYGEPIPILDLPHIFDRFYRVEKSRNRDDGGSGLGLAIAKSIIDIHGGNISVSSDNNKTIFEVKLPLLTIV